MSCRSDLWRDAGNLPADKMSARRFPPISCGNTGAPKFLLTFGGLFFILALVFETIMNKFKQLGNLWPTI